ncbi:hypothetical protein CHS0354_038818 [Potamilus streckersoni]|uniref:Splicing factor Cactin n=1 Tax=Potamilus streckersoni TaxID=2493646 RepID=A0AAE0TH03_9BIVA|nr:hypothetical protein CHS0354_038818 [Potamilus streckersoni]
MGNKDKKQHKQKSRSRSRSRDREGQYIKSKDRKRHYNNRDESDSSSLDRRQSKKHKEQSKSQEEKKHRKSHHKSGSFTSEDNSDHTRSQERKKHKKSRRVSVSSTSSEESSPDSGMSRTRMIENDILRLKEERRQRKEIIKATETPEDKRARRLAKKELKEIRRKEKMGWDKEYLGYTNADNPFGDEHLLDTFVWSKKMDKEGKRSLSKEEIQQLQKQKMEENRRELEKVKKRRLEREKEMEERQSEREQMQREKEAEYYREWEKQEDSFHLQQAKLRSQIRVQDGRAKPIDLLAKYISAEDDELAVEMHEPYTYLYGLTIPDLEDLLEDIKVYLELEQGKNADYWRDIITVTTDELNKLRKVDADSREFRDRREGINQSVSEEVATIFKGKTTKQLLLLEEQIKKKLQGGEGVDVGYWESLLQQLKAHMARTRLRERHQDVLRQKLFKLKQEQGITSEPLFPVVLSGSRDNLKGSGTPDPLPSQDREMDSTQEPGPSQDRETDSSQEPGPSREDSASIQVKIKQEMVNEEEENSDEEEEEGETVLTEEDLEPPEVLDYKAGNYSPKLLQPEDLNIDDVVYDVEDDMKKLELAREQVRYTGQVKLDAETEFEKKAREGMNDDEAQFSVEFQLEHNSFLWSDKYRPRKPRFFNRVHTGFEWNKYNQTHYDIDNPPPKIVQGYKFNIFYPDLIDKTKTPEYTVTPLEDNKDFGVLRFHAGPPYEDIAFKVVNREWEFSYKRGFRCQFANNIFQLWFHFKRYRYRR